MLRWPEVALESVLAMLMAMLEFMSRQHIREVNRQQLAAMEDSRDAQANAFSSI